MKVSKNWLLDPASFQKIRRDLVRGLLDSFIVKGYRDATIQKHYEEIQAVMSWLDNNEHINFLSSKDKARKCYSEYVDHLYHRINTEKKFTPLSGNKQQMRLIAMLKAYFNEEYRYIVRDIPAIVYKHNEVEAPETKDVKEYLSVVKVLSLQLSRELVSNKPFPLQLKFDSYTTFLFPAKNGNNIKTPYSKEPHRVYNFDEGRIATESEYSKNRNWSKSTVTRGVNNATRLLDECNTDPSHVLWNGPVTTCALSYAVLFQMITAANTELVPNLEYRDALEIVKSPIKSDMRTLKFRANGKLIRLPVGGVYGIKILKEYLIFRNFILDGVDFKYLFFRLEKHSHPRKPLQLMNDWQSKYMGKRLRGKYLPETFKNINPGKVRKYKNIILYNLRTDPSVAAGVLGHTEKTNIRSYTGISIEKQKEEFDLLWNSIEAAAKKVKVINSEKEQVISFTDITVGACGDFGNPESINPESPIKPNCEKQYGCLFCKHYCCHADETDAHKLLSLIYVLDEVRKQAVNIEHADDLLRELCVRAKHIVDSISNLSESHRVMVKDISKKVFDLGSLTRFWENRLARYEQMGVIL